MAKLTLDPAELRAVALKAVTRIFATWRLSDDEAAALRPIRSSPTTRCSGGLRSFSGIRTSSIGPTSISPP